MGQDIPSNGTTVLHDGLAKRRLARRAVLKGAAGAGIGAIGLGRLSIANDATARAQASGGDLIIGYTQEQPTLDAPVPNSDSQSRLLNSVLDPLVWQPESGVFEPGLATSWEIIRRLHPIYLSPPRRRDLPRRDTVQRRGGEALL